jgi:hypothetical protein
MTGAKVTLQRLISEVGMKSRGDDFDGLDFSSLSTSITVTGENSAIVGPQNGWSDSSGSNGLPVKTEVKALLMLFTSLTNHTASIEQIVCPSVSVVESPGLPMYNRSLTADRTRRVSRPASIMRW